MLVQHHIKYEEIHGIDEVVMMTKSDHTKLHQRLRRENKCNIPSKELGKISSAARKRTEKYKPAQAAYQAAHRKTEKGKLAHSKYQKNNINIIDFYDKVDVDIYLKERIIFNSKTGSAYAAVYFNHPRRNIVFIDI